VYKWNKYTIVKQDTIKTRNFNNIAKELSRHHPMKFYKISPSGLEVVTYWYSLKQLSSRCSKNKK